MKSFAPNLIQALKLSYHNESRNMPAKTNFEQFMSQTSKTISKKTIIVVVEEDQTPKKRYGRPAE